MKEAPRDRLIRFLPRLRRFAYALTGNMDQGDDLVQETCERALSRLGQWNAETSLESWMFRIAQNIWIDGLRRDKVRGEHTSIDMIPDPVGTDGRAVTESRLTLQTVKNSIRQLPDNQQVLIALICVDGVSYKEAAEILKVPLGTVMSRLARARQTLYTSMTTIDGPGAYSSKPEKRHG